MTTLLLIRHGETPWNKLRKVQGLTNISLGEEGRAQAKRLAKRLDGNFDTVYSSPLSRAFETASILCEDTMLSPIPVENLKEVNFGSWEGMTFKEISTAYPEHYNTWLSDPLIGPMYDGEGSTKAASIRAKTCLLELVTRHPGETIVVLSHGAFIKSALIGLFDWEMTMYHRLALGNTCITTIQFTNTLKPILMGLNDTNHLIHNATTV